MSIMKQVQNNIMEFFSHMEGIFSMKSREIPEELTDVFDCVYIYDGILSQKEDRINMHNDFLNLKNDFQKSLQEYKDKQKHG